MSFWDFKRGTASAQQLIDFGHDRGLATESLIQGTHLSLESLNDPNAELLASQELRLINNLLQQLPNSLELGVEVGLRYHLTAHGIWGYGLMSSSTARNAVTMALRFLPLTAAFTPVTYHEEGQYGVLSFGEPELAGDLKRFVIARDMAAAIVALQELVGPDFFLTRLTFNASAKFALKSASALKSLGVEPQYGEKLNTVVFEHAFMDQPLLQANRNTMSMCEQLCSQLLERRRARSDTASAVREYLSVPGTTLPNLTALAKLANTSERTLKRHLKEEGTSFRAIQTEIRRTTAKELLNDQSLSMTTIANRLGFSDSSSFSQSFKRWFGMAPNTYRKLVQPKEAQTAKSPH